MVIDMRTSIFFSAKVLRIKCYLSCLACIAPFKMDQSPDLVTKTSRRVTARKALSARLPIALQLYFGHGKLHAGAMESFTVFPCSHWNKLTSG